MEILILSLLDKVRRLNPSLHIRYFASIRPPKANTDKGQTLMNSYVIIRREYSYLEPLVRSMFENAEDVTVLIDRRSEDRSGTPPSGIATERTDAIERRSSKPMLDILINVPS
jgi:hypothetical protein